MSGEVWKYAAVDWPCSVLSSDLVGHHMARLNSSAEGQACNKSIDNFHTHTEKKAQVKVNVNIEMLIKCMVNPIHGRSNDCDYLHVWTSIMVTQVLHLTLQHQTKRQKQRSTCFTTLKLQLKKKNYH